MGAFRRMGWLRAPLAGAAAWAACGLGAAVAQAPPGKAVEVWYGVERVSGPRPSEPAPRPTPVATMPAPGVYVLPASGYPFTPSTPPPPAVLPSAAFFPASGHSPPPAEKPSAVVPTAHWSEDRPGGALDNALHRAEATKTHAESPRRPTPRPQPKKDKPAAAAPAAPPASPPAVVEHAPPPTEARPDQSQSFLYHVALVQLVSVVGSLVVGPVAVLLALLFALRRFKGSGSLLRVEVVNSGTPPPTIVYGGPAAWPAPVPAGGDGAQAGSEAQAAAASAEPKEPEKTAQPFELGPTYEEERARREEAERQREQAVLQHVYEDNVRLRERLAQAEGAAPASE